MIRARASMDDGILTRLREAHVRGLLRAVAHLHSRILQVLNVPNTGTRVRRSRGRGSYTAYLNPSKPGEPPRKRTGWLQRNVVYDVDKQRLSARVGLTVNAKYGIYLELGTSRMHPRPWLLATAKAEAANVVDIIRQEVSRV